MDISKKIARNLRKNQTESEKVFWSVVRDKRLKGKKFYRQYPIEFIYMGKMKFFIADFYCFEEKLVIEIDGKIHESKKEYDGMRTHLINNLGLRVIRFKNEEITDIATVEKLLSNYF